MSKAKYLITLVFVFLMLSGFFTSTSLAKNERELAEKLAQQFKFYELAEEILLKELDRTDITDKDKEVDYKYKCAESLRDVYKWHAAHLERLNQPVKAKEYRDKAEKLMDEWTEKRYGDDERGQIFRAGQILTDGSNLINRAKFEEDPTKRQELLSESEDNFRRALAIYQAIAEKYIPMIDEILSGIDDPDDPEYQNWIIKYNLLKISWYHWSKALYYLGKMGINTDENYKIALKQIDTMSFEISADAIAYRALLLQADIQYEQEKYSKAVSSCDSVLDLKITLPDWSEAQQKEVNELRQEAFYKIAQASMALKKYEDAVTYLRKMIDVDYKDLTQDWYVKLGRLLRAEAQIKMGEDPAEVIKEESFSSFRKDPEEFFRRKYYDVLASIGRYPELNLKTRIICARAAYDQNRLTDAVPIYQLALNQLDDEMDYERYAPEIYFRVGDSFQKNWRFAEAATVLIEGAQRLVFLNFKYANTKDVPVHMQENFSLKQRFLFMDDSKKYQIELVKKIAVTLAEKAHKNAIWLPGATDLGTQTYIFARDIETRKSIIEGIVGGSEKAQQINFQTEVYDKRYVQKWKEYKNSNEEKANFYSTIAAFSALTRIVGERGYLNSLYNSADLMQIQYKLIESDRDKNARPFPEKVDWALSDSFENGTRNYSGVKFYQWEKSRIGNDNLLGINEDMQKVLIGYLDKILDQTDDLKLLYYNKSLYFYTKFIFETILIDKIAFEETHKGIFDQKLEIIVDTFGKYVKKIYQKKIGIIVDDSNIKVSSVLDEMVVADIQSLMDDYSRSCLDLGLLLRSNPWSKSGFMREKILKEQALLSKKDQKYKDNLKKIEDYIELSNEIEENITNYWVDYDGNYGIYFTDKENEQNDKLLRSKYFGRAKTVLYLAFYLHLKFEKYFEAELDYLAYSNVFAQEMDKDEELRKRGYKMVQNLADHFEMYNVKKFGRYTDAYAFLARIRADLLSNKFVSIDDIKKGLNTAALEDRMELKDNEQVIINDKETLMNLLKKQDSDIYRMVENTPFQNFIIDTMKQFTQWATSKETDKIKQYCDKLNYDLLESLKTYYTRDSVKDIEGKDILDVFAEELIEISKSEGSTKTHPVISRLYDNFLIVVYMDRQFIADRIFEVMKIYKDKFINVGARAAKYEYLFQKLYRGEKIHRKTLLKVGRKLFDSEQYPQAIDFLQNLMTQLENDEDMNIFKTINGVRETGPISSDEKDFKSEIVIRSMLAIAYMNLAIKEITYTPDSKYFKQAEFNLARLFDFIRYRFEQQQLGEYKGMNWEKSLDQYYYLIMLNYKELLEMKSAYIINNGGTYEIDMDINSKSMRLDLKTSKMVLSGEDIKSVEAADAAFTTLTRVLWICHYLSNQAANFSPDQRKYKYLDYYHAYILIAQIGNEKKYNEKLLKANDEYTKLLGNKNLDEIVFFGDPEFSIEFKKLIRQIDKLIEERSLKPGK